MSVVPAGNEAAHTTATNWPLVATDTFALVRPATLSVFAGKKDGAACGAAATSANAHPSAAGIIVGALVL
jgi:hypothetical protein